jgi:hypothetical protein
MAMWILALAAIAACAFAQNDASAEVEIDNGVVVGTDSNLDSLIASTEFLLIEFCMFSC